MAEEEDKHLLEGKVILLGDAGVGKTNLINISIGEKFDPNKACTITASFVEKKFEIDSIKYKLYLWDTAGSETYRGLTKLFFKGSDIVIFVYEITDKKSFNNLESWINDAKEIIDNNYVFGIVGNKNDLYNIEQVPEKEAKEYAQSKGAKFKLVSAKEDPKSFIDFLFDLTKDAKKLLEEKKEKILLEKEKAKKKKKSRKC